MTAREWKALDYPIATTLPQPAQISNGRANAVACMGRVSLDYAGSSMMQRLEWLP